MKCITCSLDIETHTLNIYYPNKKEEQTWKFEYFVFGSISSTDIDVAINAPEIAFSLDPHYHTVLCDNLVTELQKLFWNVFHDYRPINPCLVSLNNGTITKCQKGSVDETNNSIFHTFGFHSQIQMFKVCPITHTLKRSVQIKVLGAIRMMTGILTNADLDIEDTRKLALNSLLIDELKLLDKDELQRYLSTILKGCDIKTSSWKTVNKTLTIGHDLEQKCKRLRQRRNIICTNLLRCISLNYNREEIINNFNEYWNVYLESQDLTSLLHSKILDNSHLFDNVFLDSFKADVIGSNLTLRCLAKSALRAQFVSFQVHLLSNIDFGKLHIEGTSIDVADKLKSIAFQIGQTLALVTSNDELYDKESISKIYVELHNFLFRKTILSADFVELNRLLSVLTLMMKNEKIDGLKMTSRELKMKSL